MTHRKSSILVRVYHDYYGCETGCCGHTVELTSPEGDEKTSFRFTHPYSEAECADLAAWGRNLAEKVIAREWPECIESIDWASLVVEASDD